MSNLVKHNKKFGEGVLAAAQKEVDEEKQKAAVGFIAQIITQRDQAEQNKLWCQKVVQFLDKKIVAIRMGHFTYDPMANSFTFNEKELNNTQPQR